MTETPSFDEFRNSKSAMNSVVSCFTILPVAYCMWVEKIKSGSREIRRVVRDRIFTSASAALGFIIGLAWNDAISSLIKYIFPSERNSLWAKFIYAMIITAVIASAIYYAERLLRTEKKQ